MECNNTPKTNKELRADFFHNKGTTFWTVDEAKSIECFQKEQFCFVEEAFVDEQTATAYLNQKGFGGLVYNPAGICKLITPNG